MDTRDPAVTLGPRRRTENETQKDGDKAARRLARREKTHGDLPNFSVAQYRASLTARLLAADGKHQFRPVLEIYTDFF